MGYRGWPCPYEQIPAFIKTDRDTTIYGRGGHVNCNGQLQFDGSGIKYLQYESPGFSWTPTDAASVSSMSNLVTHPSTNKLWGRILYEYNWFFGYVEPGVGITAVLPILNPGYIFTGQTFVQTNSTGFQVLTCNPPI